jgi:hypothetical protein
MIPKVHGATTSRSRPAGPTDGIGMEFIGASHIDDKGRPPYPTLVYYAIRLRTKCTRVHKLLRNAI